MSRIGMPSVIATASSRPASAHSRIASAAKGGGTNIADTFAPVERMASATELKIGTRCARMLEELAAFAGCDARDDLCAVVERKPGMAGAEVAGDALNENLGFGRDENGHVGKGFS